MTKDMLDELYMALAQDDRLQDVCVKSFVRPEGLEADKPSVVIKPVSSPIQAVRGSNTSLAKRYIFQINVESINYLECKKIQKIVEEHFEAKGFYQMTDAMSNLEDYLPTIQRYVDVRTYQGLSPLYQNY